MWRHTEWPEVEHGMTLETLLSSDLDLDSIQFQLIWKYIRFLHIQFPKAALSDRATEERERVCRLILLRQCGNSSRTVADDSQTSIRAHRRWGNLESIKTHRVRVNQHADGKHTSTSQYNCIHFILSFKYSQDDLVLWYNMPPPIWKTLNIEKLWLKMTFLKQINTGC